MSSAMNADFLTAINGKAVYKGDLLYSVWHGQQDFAKGIYVDPVDGDVYITFERIGQAAITSCLPIPKGKG